MFDIQAFFLYEVAMNKNKFQKYLDFRGISKAQAAKEIGCSRQYVYMLADGQPAGKKVALRIERWSDGFVPATQMMGLDKAWEETSALDEYPL